MPSTARPARPGRAVRLVVFVALAVLTAACTSSDDAAPVDVILRTPPSTEAPSDQPPPLQLGILLPRSGVFAPLGVSAEVGIDLALDEIDATGGVLGRPLEVIRADTGSDAGVAADAASTMLDEASITALVGPASAVTGEAVLGLLSDSDIVVCSPSIAAADLGGSDPPTSLIRTMPTDELTGRALGAQVTASGAGQVAILAPDDGRGDQWTAAVAAGIGDDAEIVRDQPYEPSDISFGDEATVLMDSGAEALVLLARDEGVDIIRTLRLAGFDQPIWVTEQLGSADLAGQIATNPAGPDGGPVRAGDIRMVWAAAASSDPDFTTRFVDAAPDDTDQLFAAHAHDCVVTIALAAEQAGSTDPAEFSRFLATVTRAGTPCNGWAGCQALLADGEDIDFNGASGPIELRNGVPTVGVFETVGWTEDGGREVLGTFTYPTTG